MASVLRPCPVANTRVRADSLGGTSTTCSPSASSRLAMCPPMPWQPSIAQVRSGHRLASASIARYPAASVPYRPPPSNGLIAGHDLDRGRALVRVHPDDYLAHPSPPADRAVVAGQGGHRYFEQGKPLLSLSSLHGGTRPAQAK